MGKIRQTIRVNGKDSWTLFDSGARNSYIVPDVARHLKVTDLPLPTRTKLGGETKVSSQAALLVGTIADKPFHTEAMILNEIGADEDGRPTEILFGALAMQQWGIRLILESEELDLSHYPSEFLEF
ncbi:MAG TPA: hypothetical protein HPP77_06785 [Candidatus Hydrogenedentes bacterium]|nr:hypothetical protein [Candidatus Hydrogenedentota bacterium]HIJ74144.1 hypothetical protein [Candidatus Hydrogenedentota bacterium]